MKKEIIQMQKLFEATEMTNPIDEHSQVHSLKMKRKNLVSLMKSLDIYSSVYGVILAFFFLMKKIGIGLTVIQSAYLLLSISIIGSVSITAGSAYAVKTYLIDTHEEKKPVPHINAPPKTLIAIDKPSSIGSAEDNKIDSSKKYISFQGFSGNSVDKNLLQRATKALIKEFSHTSGSTAITTEDDAYARYKLSGSIEMIEGGYQISIRLIEIETRRIMFASYEESVTGDAILDYVKKMGGELSGRKFH